MVFGKGKQKSKENLGQRIAELERELAILKATLEEQKREEKTLAAKASKMPLRGKTEQKREPAKAAYYDCLWNGAPPEPVTSPLT